MILLWFFQYMSLRAHLQRIQRPEMLMRARAATLTYSWIIPDSEWMTWRHRAHTWDPAPPYIPDLEQGERQVPSATPTLTSSPPLSPLPQPSSHTSSLTQGTLPPTYESIWRDEYLHRRPSAQDIPVSGSPTSSLAIFPLPSSSSCPRRPLRPSISGSPLNGGRGARSSLPHRASLPSQPS